jgi:hypothetical protein
MFYISLSLRVYVCVCVCTCRFVNKEKLVPLATFYPSCLVWEIHLPHTNTESSPSNLSLHISTSPERLNQSHSHWHYVSAEL